jgi:hypothetical protein
MRLKFSDEDVRKVMIGTANNGRILESTSHRRMSCDYRWYTCFLR